MVPLSLSYVVPSTDMTAALDKTGVIVEISAKEWLPIDS